MTELTCHHCGYDWDYGGDADFYASCPRCHYNVRLPEGEDDG